MILTGVKFTSFFIITYLFYHGINRISLTHDLFYSTGLTIAVLYIAWQISAILMFLNKSRKNVNSTGDSKCVLITGCDTGFGHAIALQLNQSGFTVFAGCLFHDRKEAQSLLTKCKHPEKMHLLSLNVRSAADIEKAYNRIQEHTSRTGDHMHSLINNAGISGWAPLEWGSMEQDIEPVIDVDLTAVMQVTRTFLPMLRQNVKSRIIFMTSYITHVSVPMIATYVVAKKGVKAFADALRAEVNADPDFYNNMKILNVEPTAYKTGLLGYDVVTRSVNLTWSRTSDRVKHDYGHPIYEAFTSFIAVCKFFEYFDFVAVRSDLSEVGHVVDNLLRSKDPEEDTALMSFTTLLMFRYVDNYVPDEVMECFFHFLAMQVLIFAFEVSCIKSFFRT